MKTAAKGLSGNDSAQFVPLRKKPLVSVEEFAADQGVSAELIEKCIELGVVRVRKFHDRTYVIDLQPQFEINGSGGDLGEVAARLVEEHLSRSAKSDDGPQRQFQKMNWPTVEEEELSGLADHDFEKDFFPLTRESDIARGHFDDKVEADISEAELESLRQIEESPELSRSQPGSAKTKLIWQIIALAATVFFLASAVFNVSLVRNRLQLVNQIDHLYENSRAAWLENQQLQNKIEAGNVALGQSSGEIQELNQKLAAAERQVASMGTDLGSVQQQFQQSQQQLSETRQRLASIQANNAEAVSELNQQIETLSVRMDELISGN